MCGLSQCVAVRKPDDLSRSVVAMHLERCIQIVCEFWWCGRLRQTATDRCRPATFNSRKFFVDADGLRLFIHSDLSRSAILKLLNSP